MDRRRTKPTATLNSFVKNECANYDRNRNECLHGFKCLVLEGRTCKYFQKSVLGPPDYKFRVAGYDYETIFRQYSEIKKNLKGEIHKLNVNTCNECGNAIPPGFSYCEKCGKKRKRLLDRERKRQRRKQQFVRFLS